MSTLKVKKYQNIFKAEICRKIKAFADQKGMTRAELARRTGISYRIIHGVFAGKATLRDKTIERIAAGLGINYEAIAGDNGAAMVKETSAKYSTPKVKTGTIIDAIRIISEQLQVPQEEVADKFGELMRKKVEGKKEVHG